MLAHLKGTKLLTICFMKWENQLEKICQYFVFVRHGYLLKWIFGYRNFRHTMVEVMEVSWKVDQVWGGISICCLLWEMVGAASRHDTVWARSGGGGCGNKVRKRLWGAFNIEHWTMLRLGKVAKNSYQKILGFFWPKGGGSHPIQKGFIRKTEIFWHNLKKKNWDFFDHFSPKWGGGSCPIQKGFIRKTEIFWHNLPKKRGGL